MAVWRILVNSSKSEIGKSEYLKSDLSDLDRENISIRSRSANSQNNLRIFQSVRFRFVTRAQPRPITTLLGSEREEGALPRGEGTLRIELWILLFYLWTQRDLWECVKIVFSVWTSRPGVLIC